MDICYVSHCVPWPPDKGERIRAFNSVNQLVRRHRVHVACLARDPKEAHADSELRRRCASVHVEVLNAPRAFARALVRFASGRCFSTAFYWNPALDRHIRKVAADCPIAAVILLSSGMAVYAPEAIPFIADWGDVDSEKWLQYSRTRFPGFLYAAESRRVRKTECEYAFRSRRAFFTTPNELKLFREIAPEAPAGCAGNGVDFEFFDPRLPFNLANLRNRQFLVFVGVLNYFPNSDGVCRFAETVFPELRRRNPQLELFLVGRNPAENVLRLASKPGITVTGTVADVRPYLAAARGVIAPLQIARGIQNKVLEALAMGKTVLASKQVCATFAPQLPAGIVPCESVESYVRSVEALPSPASSNANIRDAAQARFSWSENLAPIMAELDAIEQSGKRPRVTGAWI
ncbi:MAG: TIGR03087 family PEP-CTERM/XrtA system glycosyltransferase [Bryobacterales bacterium]|nr:TIGR03087 family PEP-CTERM/XrtA system glycosyltransferase [Bryobacterales bacterium]